MKFMRKRIVVCMLCGTLLIQPAAGIWEGSTIVAEAHSGRTDGSGGHRDNKNKSGLGSYHYHCGGYPAHLHNGGVCPYSSSSSTTTSSSSSTATTISSSDNSSGKISSASAQSTSVSTSGKYLKLSTGDEVSLTKDLVKIIQDVLNQKGYECGEPDGIIGSKTKEALEKYMEECKENEETQDSDYLIISMVMESLGLLK